MNELVLRDGGDAATGAANIEDIAPARHGLEPYEATVDVRSRSQYRQRMLALDEELCEARRLHDLGRCQRLSSEWEWLRRELAMNARTRNRSAERARKAVYNCIRRAIEAVDKVHPELGRHLTLNVRTGMCCCYRPELDLRWVTATG